MKCSRIPIILAAAYENAGPAPVKTGVSALKKHNLNQSFTTVDSEGGVHDNATYLITEP